MSLRQKLRFWLAKILIKTGRLQQVHYDADYLEPIIAQALPHQEHFDVPGGQASLTIMTADVTIGGDNQSGLYLRLLCSFEITSLQRQLYRAHLHVDINAVPFYQQSSMSIRIEHATVKKVSLIQDEYLMINTPIDLINAFTPNLFKGLVDATIGTAMAMVSELTPPVKDYLTVYTQMNKQKVLDFHRPQIQQLLGDLIAREDLCYQLDMNDFEERLFAQLGQRMDIENHQLVFKF